MNIWPVECVLKVLAATNVQNRRHVAFYIFSPKSSRRHADFFVGGSKIIRDDRSGSPQDPLNRKISIFQGGLETFLLFSLGNDYCERQQKNATKRIKTDGSGFTARISSQPLHGLIWFKVHHKALHPSYSAHLEIISKDEMVSNVRSAEQDISKFQQFFTFSPAMFAKKITNFLWKYEICEKFFL